MREQDFKDAWDAYRDYLKKLEADRPDGTGLTVPEFLWRWFAKREAVKG